MRLAGKARPTQPSQGKASQAAEPNQPAQKSAFGLPGGSANKCGAPDRGASGGFFPAKTTIPGKQMSILIVFLTFRSNLGPKGPKFGDLAVGTWSSLLRLSSLLAYAAYGSGGRLDHMIAECSLFR